MARSRSSCIMKASDTIKNVRDMFVNESGEALAGVVDDLSLIEFKLKMQEAGRKGELDGMSDDAFEDFAADMRADINAKICMTIGDILWVLDSHPEYIYEIESLFAKLTEEESLEKK